MHADAIAAFRRGDDSLAAEVGALLEAEHHANTRAIRKLIEMYFEAQANASKKQRNRRWRQ